MPTNLRLSRRLDSYSKIRKVVSGLRRNRHFQLKTNHIAKCQYLDLGCGDNLNPDLINLDYMWRPGVDVCWDIRRGLPFSEGKFLGVFSEHCLEHFDLEDGEAICREVFRVLSRGGRFRVVVPSADLYLKTYFERIAKLSNVSFPYESKETYKDRFYTPMLSVNRIFYQDRDSAFGHRCMFDFQLLSTLLRDVGFSTTKLCDFRCGIDENLLVDSANRQCESLYVEAVK